jgi:hypothetical protein
MGLIRAGWDLPGETHLQVRANKTARGCLLDCDRQCTLKCRDVVWIRGPVDIPCPLKTQAGKPNLTLMEPRFAMPSLVSDDAATTTGR